MHTVEIPENKDFGLRYVPENLAECTDEQYMVLCGLLYRYQSAQISYETLCVQAVHSFLDLLPSSKELLNDEAENKWGNMYQLGELVESFFTTNEEGQKVIVMDFGHNPIKRFRPLWRWYYGPADYNFNLTFGEYVDALRVFSQFSVTPSIDLLRTLAAILYRQKKPFCGLRRYLPGYDGDKRKKYNVHTVSFREKTFKYAPIGFLYGVYIAFGAFQKFISTSVIPWGGRELDLSILYKDDDNFAEAVPGRGMDSVLTSLADAADIENARKLSLWDVLMRLYDLKKQDMDRKLNEKKNEK
ncbi:hypothetical protein ACLI1A_10115 [Flavobacterium sp. RHBU_3]|uniref:hypothetical protein n=1 Tax=Flavobacterium sp. RHBU_3 TaxID=3391184 RepID=UPI0039856671